MRVGLYAPLPPVRSGVADYAAVLASAMEQAGAAVEPGEPGDVGLYHMGNNGLHKEIYRQALARPGLVVLHDAVLHHFHLGAMTREQYVEEFVWHYGGWYRGMAEGLWTGRSRSASDARYFRWPMLKRIAGQSLGVIVHNEGAREVVLREAPEAHVHVVPHFVAAPPEVDMVAVERWRAERGILPSHTTLGLFGYLRESKRVMAVLRTFSRLRKEHAGLHLLVAGQMASTDLERAAAPYLEEPGVIRIGFLPDGEWWQVAAACDVGVNLRYPSAGESSGITARLLSLGKPVIVSDTAENEALPEYCCPRIPAGLGEEEALAATVLLLSAAPSRTRLAGGRGREWQQERQSLPRVAEEYLRVLRACRDDKPQTPR